MRSLLIVLALVASSSGCTTWGCVGPRDGLAELQLVEPSNI